MHSEDYCQFIVRLRCLRGTGYSVGHRAYPTLINLRRALLLQYIRIQKELYEMGILARTITRNVATCDYLHFPAPLRPSLQVSRLCYGLRTSLLLP